MAEAARCGVGPATPAALTAKIESLLSCGLCSPGEKRDTCAHCTDRLDAITELRAYVERTERERDAAQADCVSAEHDLARLITAVRDVSAGDAIPEDALDLCRAIERNGRPGWLQRALAPTTSGPVRDRAEPAEALDDIREALGLDDTADVRAMVEAIERLRETDRDYVRLVREICGEPTPPVAIEQLVDAVGELHEHSRELAELRSLLDDHRAESDRLGARAGDLEPETDREVIERLATGRALATQLAAMVRRASREITPRLRDGLLADLERELRDAGVSE